MFPSSSLAISQRWELIDLPLRATFSPSHPLARRDVPLTQGRVFLCFLLGPQGSRQAVLHCAHRTSTVSSCAFCEHKGWSGDSPSSPSEASGCTSTEDHQTPAPPLFREQENDQAARYPQPGSLGQSRAPLTKPFHRRSMTS